jgi:hypothetical protein
MTTAQDLLQWLLNRGYYVDWRCDPSLVVDWYAALNPFAWNRISQEGMEDLALKASLELDAVVTAGYRDSPAYTSFKGESIDGHTISGGRPLNEMNYLVLWDKEGHIVCQVIMLYNE